VENPGKTTTTYLWGTRQEDGGNNKKMRDKRKRKKKQRKEHGQLLVGEGERLAEKFGETRGTTLVESKIAKQHEEGVPKG